jgi:hypothetical protein
LLFQAISAVKFRNQINVLLVSVKPITEELKMETATYNSRCIEWRHTSDLREAWRELLTWIVPAVEGLDDLVWLRLGPMLIDYRTCWQNGGRFVYLLRSKLSRFLLGFWK